MYLGLQLERRCLALALACLTAVAVAACVQDTPVAAAQPAATGTVELEAVKQSRVPVTLEYDGIAVGSREVQVRARVQGTLMERTYSEGTRVRRGEVLFRIDPHPYQIALEAAQAQLQEAIARHSASIGKMKRNTTLYEHGMISAQARDDANSDVELAAAAVSLAHAGVDAAKLNLDYTIVKAPVSGIAGREMHSVGNLVAGEPENTILTTILALDPLYINFAYPDREWRAERIRPAEERSLVRPVHLRRVFIRLPDEATSNRVGTIDFVGMSIDNTSGTVSARAVYPNPDGDIIPGQLVRVAVLDADPLKRSVITEGALIRGPSGTYVYRLTNRHVVEAVSVRVGSRTPEGIEIVSGLAPGDVIVASGAESIRAGQRLDMHEVSEHAR